ncbi:MAG TPA: DUF1992 domain-containing protein [Oligoflexus sp.]|uniref:DnaJ family domain-containing protein n=1 Tax=Oligoflexus sp. TaxID=1971216 RepID=UPI002D6BE5D0|nr:DUF1992 domain-containing protein [Oligoflexus sp.]HYX34354.1 DUF1992 domain-containing protein [Oligoflexus sp.]
MTDIFNFLALHAIEEAMRRGEFDNLKGAGQPLPPIEGSAIDRWMKSKGIMPREVELRKKLAEKRVAGAGHNECQDLEIEIRILTEQRMLQQASRQI